MKRKVKCRNSNKTCYYCHRNLNRFTRTIDHLIPISRGGPNRIYNRVYCCKECNNEKGDMTVKEYNIYLSLKTKYTRKELRKICEKQGILFDPKERRNRNTRERLLRKKE